MDRDLTHKEKWKIILQIKRRLTEVEIPNDIIINSVNWVEKYRDDVGRITYYALKDGVQV